MHAQHNIAASGDDQAKCRETSQIKQTLAQTAGNKTRAARALGIAVSTLYVKIRRHNLAT